ncbi:MAG: hypothetical protein GIX00_09485 [Candidatus Eremiobacteraeota bacterium]|nr:hypothetical protein [Candidatus Eremiobacteraeota bacterium]MBC5808820.1 hypothetical protein [Candidatus Eremiobacteraeota bacterium]
MPAWLRKLDPAVRAQVIAQLRGGRKAQAYGAPPKRYSKRVDKPKRTFNRGIGRVIVDSDDCD